MMRARFDHSISVMDRYETSEIRLFLRWANYNMTDALQVRVCNTGAGAACAFASVCTTNSLASA